MADDVNITIYLKTVRAYFNKMTDRQRLYFYEKKDEELFFEKIRECAIENFKKIGEPTLTVVQFEEIKHSLRSSIDNGVYVEYVDYRLIGRIYLN